MGSYLESSRFTDVFAVAATANSNGEDDDDEDHDDDEWINADSFPLDVF